MSSQRSNHDHDPHHGQQSEDAVDYGKVILVGVVSLAIFAVATVWAARILKNQTAELERERGAPKPVMVGKPEIGIVDQVPFASDRRIEVWRKAHADRLNGYGWVDHARGVAHIPIEKAMDMVAAGAGPAGAPK